MQETLHKARQIWRKWSYLGITDDLSIEEVIRTRLVNMVSFISFFWIISLFIAALISGEFEHFIVILISFIIQITIFVFNINKRQIFARYIAIILFSIYLFLFWLFFDSQWGSEFIILLVIFLTFIFFTGKRQRNLVIYQCVLYVIALFAVDYIPDNYKNQIEPFPYVTEYSFVFYVIFYTFVFGYYQREIRRYRLSQVELITNLTQNNLNLERVKEKIRHFTEIVSSTLLKESKVVNEQINQMTKLTFQNDYKSLKIALDKNLITANQMYFWVNDVLELSSFNDINNYSKQAVNLNETLQNVIQNLEQIMPTINTKIITDSLPTIVINETEVFVVFYNLLQTFLSENRPQEILNIKYIQSNKQLTLRFQNNQLQPTTESVTAFLQAELKLAELFIHSWNGKLHYISDAGNVIVKIEILLNS